MSLRSFSNVYFDIGGICNAKCFWCEQGCRSHGALPTIEPEHPVFTTPELMEETLASLFVISPEATIHPFNWGDPFLNPRLPEILRIIGNKGLSCFLSTNGATPLRLGKDDDLSHATGIRFSILTTGRTDSGST